MEALKTMPTSFIEHPDAVMTNADHSINYEAAKLLKDKPLFAQYSGWNFCGYIWWDKDTDKWCCVVWVYHKHVETVCADTLEEIMEAVSNSYGQE